MKSAAMFQVASIALVWSSMRDPAWLGVFAAVIAISVHLASAEARKKELRAIAIFAAGGLVCESALMAAGVVKFAGGGELGPLCPPWVVLLWAGLGTLTEGPLKPLRERPWIAGVVALLVAPVSFIGGEAAGAIALTRPLPPSFAIVAIACGATFFAVFTLSRRR